LLGVIQIEQVSRAGRGGYNNYSKMHQHQVVEMKVGREGKAGEPAAGRKKVMELGKSGWPS
jgi:hypothetical protein